MFPPLLLQSFKAGIDGMGQQKQLQRESQQYLNELSDQLRSLSAVDLSAKVGAGVFVC
jgi:hypothetical protein